MADATIWIVDDDTSIRWVLERALIKAGFQVRQFENGADILDALTLEQPHVIMSDVRMPGIDGVELLGRVKEEHPQLPMIIMTAHSDFESTVASFQAGAFEYLPKPFDVDEVVATVSRAVEHRKELGDSGPEIVEDLAADHIVGQAPAMQEVFKAVGRLTQSSATVLITGESGTGKELVAEALHRHSPRSTAAFVALNMAALPSELIEAELFGHERGAFTGANEQRAGRFEQANGGTLFLDEIGDMPIAAQTRLLRVLSDGSFYRIGGRHDIRVDVRIIAATHQDLEQLVADGTFREDLYHRLNVIRIHVPPLRHRRSDIAALTTRFLTDSARELNVERKTLSADALDFMESLGWPGNVRQLENTCSWLSVMAPGREVLLEDLPPELNTATPAQVDHDWQTALSAWARERLNEGEASILDAAQPAFERTMIEAALERTGGRKREASHLLGWGRNTLTRKMTELEIN